MEANLSAKSFEIILNLKFATTIGLDSFIEVAPWILRDKRNHVSVHP